MNNLKIVVINKVNMLYNNSNKLKIKLNMQKDAGNRGDISRHLKNLGLTQRTIKQIFVLFDNADKQTKQRHINVINRKLSKLNSPIEVYYKLNPHWAKGIKTIKK